jgi:hypothetical protein
MHGEPRLRLRQPTGREIFFSGRGYVGQVGALPAQLHDFCLHAHIFAEPLRPFGSLALPGFGPALPITNHQSPFTFHFSPVRRAQRLLTAGFPPSPSPLSFATSAGLSSLNSPGWSTLSESGPILVLWSLLTLYPIAANTRRTWRVRP